MTLAHIGGVPVEELAPAAAGAGGALLFARAWLGVHLRRTRKEDAAEGDGKPTASSW